MLIFFYKVCNNYSGDMFVIASNRIKKKSFYFAMVKACMQIWRTREDIFCTKSFWKTPSPFNMLFKIRN